MPTQRITFDPDIMGGRPCIRGMRLPVATIIRCIASDMSQVEIIEAYPELEPADIQAALRYAAEVTEDRTIPLTGTNG